MKKYRKIVCIIITLLFLTVGIFYPKTEYYINYSNEHNILRSHFSTAYPTEDTINAPDEYAKPFHFDFYQADFDGMRQPGITLLINKKYEKYHLHEIYFEWENGNYTEIYDFTRVINYNEGVFYKDGWYYGDYLYPIKINFAKIFSNKDKGKKFDLKMTIKYHFDDEEVAYQDIYYEVLIETIIKNFSLVKTIFMIIEGVIG